MPSDRVTSPLRPRLRTLPTGTVKSQIPVNSDQHGPNGVYSAPRPCTQCGAEFLSRDAFWRHHFTQHEDTP